ncbi:MAG: hypothetical protein COC01_06690, partial [Bacteroidetes bacterium]
MSVLIRIPSLDRPLALHHEWGTAHILITLQIWEEYGISTYNYNPVFTFENAGDKYPTDLGRIGDEDGNYYYTSYPPFTFYFPFLVFKLLGIYPDVLPIQILHLVLHFISAILIYFIVCNICSKPIGNKLFFPALLSSCLYIFLPNNLWYLCNVFSVEIFSQTLFLVALFATSYVLKDTYPNRKRNLILLITVFLLAFTEYIGFLFLIPLLFIIYRSQTKDSTRLISGLIIGGFSAFLFCIFIYSNICGVQCLVDNLIDRYHFRSGTTENSELQLTYFNLSSYSRIFTSYTWEYSRVFLMYFLALVATYIFIFKKSSLTELSRLEKNILVLSWVPVILHHLILFGFTAVQSFAVCKTSIPIIITIGILSNKLINVLTRKLKMVSLLITIILIPLLVFHFYKVNFRDYVNPGYKEIGVQIAKNNKSDELVFVTGYDAEFLICPQTNFYARRNVAYCKDINDAESKLKSFNIDKGVIFEINENR